MKRTLGGLPLVYPIPIVLVGADVQGRANFATIGQCGLMGVKPPVVYVSLHREHHTTAGIVENGTYSINLPSSGLLAETDYCGIVSGARVDKSDLFEVFYGRVGTAPMIEECPVNLECRVIKDFAVEHRRIFVGEVVEAYVEEALVTDAEGRQLIADLTRLDPIIYALDNRYYRIGEIIGTGYGEGKALVEGDG